MPHFTALTGYSAYVRKFKDHSQVGDVSNWNGTSVTARYIIDTKSPLQVSVPDFRGWRNPLPYNRNVHSEDWLWRGDVRYISRRDTDTYWDTSYFPYFPVNGRLAQPDHSTPSAPSVLRQRAEVEALVKLKELKVQYAVLLRELTKSTSLIDKTIWTLYDSYKAARKRHWGRASTLLGVGRHKFRAPSKDVAGRWLELQYGWGPMLMDLQGLYEDSTQGLLANTPILSVVRDCGISLKKERYESDPLSPQVMISYKEDGKAGFRVRLDYVLNDDLLRTAANTGLSDIASVAWETTPWSFVLDWVVPIGAWLEALHATSGLTFRGGSCTEYVKFNRQGRAVKAPGPPPNQGMTGGYIDSCNLQSILTVTRMNRVVYKTSPIPMPYYKNPWSTGHALNGLALLRSLF